MCKAQDLEKNIILEFEENFQFEYRGYRYVVNRVGKPTVAEGEPKTDIYLDLSYVSDYGEIPENIIYKISVKKDNADFLENKMTPASAERLFGLGWREAIQKSTQTIREKFEARPLIYKESSGRTEAGSITLGWRFELVNKNNGALSGTLELNKEQLIDVYAGTNLPEDKRNAFVNGQKILDSGIATHLYTSTIDSLNTAAILDSLRTIEEYSQEHREIYFACKAVNSRTSIFVRTRRTQREEPKVEGARYLAVYVDWFINGQRKLDYKLVFDNPLSPEHKGGEQNSKLYDCLLQLGVRNVDELKVEQVEHPEIIYWGK